MRAGILRSFKSRVPEVRHYSRAGVRPRERSRFQLTPDSVGGHQPTQMRRRAPPLTHSCYTSDTARARRIGDCLKKDLPIKKKL